MRRVWRVPALFLLSGAVAATGFALGGDPVMAAVLLVLFTLFAVVHSPLIFPGPVPAAEALRRAAADGRPVVYWRPGCTYCLRLRLRLGRDASRLHWVDIWGDPAGAAAVRAATGGDETVPTVVVADRPHINPDPAWVRRQLPPRT
ncbi:MULTISPECIES: glutaredoxin domain-containing protein [Streptomyces]|uniref:glutaredoxin domain-containing protein n=1 Tax=Streptomyces TaxID=1883 RepID=UPI00167548C5|nr:MULTISPECIES: glutaredoxin domain-containing protein [Streptomyces]WGP13813.1 glutaredoxin domain-containing protein [Streptomyces sp. SH5]